jgi:hypothetical protein
MYVFFSTISAALTIYTVADDLAKRRNKEKTPLPTPFVTSEPNVQIKKLINE